MKTPTVEDETAPESEAWDVDLHIREAGKSRLRIVADYMARFDSDDSTVVELSALNPAGRVQVTIFDENGDRIASMLAHQVRFDEDKRIMVARGDVVVESDDHHRLETESLEWNENDGRIRSDSFVRMATAENTWQGYGFQGTEDLTEFQMERFSGSFSAPED